MVNVEKKLKVDLKSKSTKLKAFLEALKTLRDERVLINKKDFTCQIGEWLVEMIFEGKRATSNNQKGWDVVVDKKQIQVKSHAKSEGNKTKYSIVVKDSTESIDELIIVVFTYDYKLKAFYKVPWEIVLPFIKLRGKKNPRYEIRWSSINSYKIEINQLPCQEIVSLFM